MAWKLERTLGLGTCTAQIIIFQAKRQKKHFPAICWPYFLEEMTVNTLKIESGFFLRDKGAGDFLLLHKSPSGHRVAY